MNLISFDIDGTLLNINDPLEYVKSYIDAFSAMYQQPFDYQTFLPHPLAGLTDLQLIKYTISKAENGTVSNEVISTFRQNLIDQFQHNFKSGLVLTNGLINFLDELKKRNTVLAICLGNLPEIGRIKLENAGIYQYFDSELLGFCWKDKRSEILKMIIQKAKEKYEIINAIHIGDTCDDVNSAIQSDAIPVAIKKFNLDKQVQCDNTFQDFEQGKDPILSLLK